MLGYVLLLVFVLATISLAGYVASRFRRSREYRRQQVRLNSAFHRAVHSREHGYPPIFPATAMLRDRSMWPMEAR